VVFEEGAATVGASCRESMGLDATNVVCLLLPFRLERRGDLLEEGRIGPRRGCATSGNHIGIGVTVGKQGQLKGLRV
jgi:hypothetical protein